MKQEPVLQLAGEMETLIVAVPQTPGAGGIPRAVTAVSAPAFETESCSDWCFKTKKLHLRAVMSCPGRTTKGFGGAGTRRMRVVKWEEIGCNLKKLESNDEPGLAGLVPRSGLCSQADAPSCRERRFFLKPQGWAVDQVITGVLKVPVSALCVKWS
ncbi:uncharacterized protein WM294_009690 [Sarcoramphus papa]